MSTPRAEFLAGVKATIPLVIGAFPFGVIFGALAITSGVSIPATMGLSLIVFAGSAQFVAVGLFAAGVSIPFIILTTFIVNLRHALYSATLAPYVKHLPQRWLPLLGFTLTDEAFVVAITHYNEPTDITHKHWYFFGEEICYYVCWQIFTWIGIFFGKLIPDPARFGLDFAMSVTFIGMLVPLMKSRPVLASVVVAGIVAVLTATMPNKIGLIIAALAGVIAGVVAEARSSAAPDPVIASEEIPV